MPLSKQSCTIRVATIILVAFLMQTQWVSAGAYYPAERTYIEERHRRRTRSRQPQQPAPLLNEKTSSGHHRERRRSPHNAALVSPVESVETRSTVVPLLVKLSSSYESEVNADQIRYSLISAYNTFQSSCTKLLSMANALQPRGITYANDQKSLTMCVQTSSCLRNCSALLLFDDENDYDNVVDSGTTRHLVRKRRRSRPNKNLTATLAPSQQMASPICKKPTTRQVVDRFNASRLDTENRGVLLVIMDITVLLNENSCVDKNPPPPSVVSAAHTSPPSLAPTIYKSVAQTVPPIESPQRMPVGTMMSSQRPVVVLTETPSSTRGSESLAPTTTALSPTSPSPTFDRGRGTASPSVGPSNNTPSSSNRSPSSKVPSVSPSILGGDDGSVSLSQQPSLMQRSEGPTTSRRPSLPSEPWDVGSGSPSSQKPSIQFTEDLPSISPRVLSQSPSFSPSALSGFPTVTLPIEWIQRGQTFVGDNSGDGLGRSLSVSSDGLTIVAGARGNDEGGDLAGVVRAYSLIDDKWVSQTVSLGNAGDVFGTSVSISGDGNTVAVGAMGPVQNVTNPLRNGYAKVYTTKLENWAWTQLGQTLLYDILGDGFGITVALSSSGNILAVGAHGGVVTTGYVRVFRLVDSDWVRLGSSVPANLPSNDRDRIMSLSGDGLTVAVVSNDYVKVFTFDVNNDEWMALSDPPMSPAEDTVLSLSHDGTTLAVGSWQRHIVRILNYRNGSWVITKDITGGRIGFSVSVSPGGNYLAVGGGHTVQIFALEDNQWVELRNSGIHRVTLSFGSTVALSSENGLSIVTGNPSGLGQIACYVYDS